MFRHQQTKIKLFAHPKPNTKPTNQQKQEELNEYENMREQVQSTTSFQMMPPMKDNRAKKKLIK